MKMVREGINHFEAEDEAHHKKGVSNLARCYTDMREHRDALLVFANFVATTTRDENTKAVALGFLSPNGAGSEP